MRVYIDSMTLDLTDEQADSLRDQLGVTGTSECEWITLQAAADRLGVSNEYLYEHARELGGRKLSDKAKSHWRFPANVELATAAGENLPPTAKSPKPKKRPKKTTGNVRLLAVRGVSPYAAPNEKRPPEALRAPAEGLDTGGGISNAHD